MVNRHPHADSIRFRYVLRTWLFLPQFQQRRPLTTRGTSKAFPGKTRGCPILVFPSWAVDEKTSVSTPCTARQAKLDTENTFSRHSPTYVHRSRNTCTLPYIHLEISTRTPLDKTTQKYPHVRLLINPRRNWCLSSLCIQKDIVTERQGTRRVDKQPYRRGHRHIYAYAKRHEDVYACSCHIAFSDLSSSRD